MDTERLLRLLKENKVEFVIIRVTAFPIYGKVLIRQYAVETDIHPFVKGAVFEQIWKNKVKAKFGNTFIYFASLRRSGRSST